MAHNPSVEALRKRINHACRDIGGAAGVIFACSEMVGERGNDTSALDLAVRVLTKALYELHAVQCELSQSVDVPAQNTETVK